VQNDPIPIAGDSLAVQKTQEKPMSQENAAEPLAEVPLAVMPAEAAPAEAPTTPEAPQAPRSVSSPPRPRVVAQPEMDAREELNRLAGEVAKRGTRRMLWDYLKLRTRVLGRPRVSGSVCRTQG
jgi:hypothetical protein